MKYIFYYVCDGYDRSKVVCVCYSDGIPDKKVKTNKVSAFQRGLSRVFG